MLRSHREAERLLDDASPLVRGAAVWALSRLIAARKICDVGKANPIRRQRRVNDEWAAALA